MASIQASRGQDSGGRPRSAGTDLAEQAVAAARAAAARSRVDVLLIHDLPDLVAVYLLFERIWQPDKSNPPVTIEHLRAMTHAGNYLAGAYDTDRTHDRRGGPSPARELVGACFGFFSAPVGAAMHSHIAGVAEPARGRSVGFALKLHQRAWALGHGLQAVTWTFDPLIRRNAYLNLVKLGAHPREYLVDFYGDMGDAINEGQGSDRLLVAWDLASPAVVRACGGTPVEPDPVDLDRATSVLAAAESGRPIVLPRDRWPGGPLLVGLPADIESLRRTDPGAARDWRLAVRDVLGELVAAGGTVAGFAKAGGYFVLPGSAQ